MGLYLASRKTIKHWLNRARIDYANHYIQLYIAYNAWYSEITGTTNDKEAMARLKKQFYIWHEYCQGNVMRDLRVYMEQLAELTQRQPINEGRRSLSVELSGVHDWRSLIDYWYQVRCLVVHGASLDKEYVYLAYETLLIFMEEVVGQDKKLYSFGR